MLNMETKKEIKFGLRYSGINVLKFSQYDVSNFNINNDNLIEYQNNFEVKVFEDTEEIGIISTTLLKIIEINENFCELKVLSKFKIVNFKEIIIKKSENSFDIPDALLLNFTTIVFGTIRGILHEKLKGTIIQNEVFPLIDIKDLWKNKGA